MPQFESEISSKAICYLPACGTVRNETYWEETRSLEGHEEYCKQGLLVHTWNSVIQKLEVEDHHDFKVSLASKETLLQKNVLILMGL